MPTSSIPSSGGGGLTPKYQKFTSSGTFTLPDGYGAAKPLVITIQVIGGGGAGTGSLGTFTVGTAAVRIRRNGYFGDAHATFPQNVGASILNTINTDFSVNANGSGGGSGGIAQTQMSLTENLTITVGAAGARATANTLNANLFENSEWGRTGSNNTGARNYNLDIVTTTGSQVTAAGGTGGTSTAGAVSATGGAGGTAGNFNVNGANVTFPADVSINSGNAIGPFNAVPTFANANHGVGAGGQPGGQRTSE
jgi:hypothetical protein